MKDERNLKRSQLFTSSQDFLKQSCVQKRCMGVTPSFTHVGQAMFAGWPQPVDLQRTGSTAGSTLLSDMFLLQVRSFFLLIFSL